MEEFLGQDENIQSSYEESITQMIEIANSGGMQ